MPQNPDVSSGVPSTAHGTVAQRAHEAETNHEMELHPPVLVRTGDGMGGFFPGADEVFNSTDASRTAKEPRLIPGAGKSVIMPPTAVECPAVLFIHHCF